MINIILGNGEVAGAIKPSIKIPVIYNKGEWETLNFKDECCLHITIPFNDLFIDTVVKADEVFSPKITVIHSTISPGTTDKIIFNIGRDNIYYSPVMGRHKDDFKANILYYNKFISGNFNTFCEVKEILKLMNPVHWGENHESLEYSKIMSTSYMYYNLVFEKIMHDDCKKNNWDFSKVYLWWNFNYNQGISKAHPEWRRPVYEHDDNKLPGGHCLSPNINLYDNKITGFLKDYEKDN